MSVILRSQKQPLGRAADQTIMIPSRKLYHHNTITKTALQKNPPTRKKPQNHKLCVNNSVSTSCKKISLANDIYNVL